MSLVKRLPMNTRGRDFVVGDIHGCYDQLLEALREAGFDRQRDRLFSVGDTVDRGPGSPRARAFLSQPWVHAVLGNHEGMFLDLYRNGEPKHELLLRHGTSRNGMGWWMDLKREEQLALIGAFRRLPVAIEVETRRGKVGFVHAEVPNGMAWDTFLARVERRDRRTIQQALWGRDRVTHGDTDGVPGIDRVFVGHTPLNRPTRLGNVFYVDTGAVFGVLGHGTRDGRLTLADISCSTAVLERSPGPKLVDVRLDEAPTSEPFGPYLGPA